MGMLSNGLSCAGLGWVRGWRGEGSGEGPRQRVEKQMRSALSGERRGKGPQAAYRCPYTVGDACMATEV